MGPLIYHLSSPEVLRIAAHCDICAQTVEFTGPLSRAMATAWTASHYRPVVDEFDIDTPFGVQTWRHTS